MLCGFLHGKPHAVRWHHPAPQEIRVRSTAIAKPPELIRTCCHTKSTLLSPAFAQRFNGGSRPLLFSLHSMAKKIGLEDLCHTDGQLRAEPLYSTMSAIRDV